MRVIFDFLKMIQTFQQVPVKSLPQNLTAGLPKVQFVTVQISTDSVFPDSEVDQQIAEGKTTRFDVSDKKGRRNLVEFFEKLKNESESC